MLPHEWTKCLGKQTRQDVLNRQTVYIHPLSKYIPWRRDSKHGE